MTVRNLFRGIPDELPEELTETLVESAGLRIERIVSRGHQTAQDSWYDQEQGEWVVVLSGRARISFADSDRRVELGPGDFMHIPPHVRHRVDWTDPKQDTVWLAVFHQA